MNQLCGVSANFLSSPQDAGLVAMAEVVIKTVESEYAFNDEMKLVRGHKVSATRFVTSADQLRELAKSLLEFADESEAAVEQALQAEIDFEDDLAEAAEPDDSDTAEPVPPVVAEASC